MKVENLEARPKGLIGIGNGCAWRKRVIKSLSRLGVNPGHKNDRETFQMLLKRLFLIRVSFFE